MACCLFISNLCPELLAPAAGGVGGGGPPLGPPCPVPGGPPPFCSFATSACDASLLRVVVYQHYAVGKVAKWLRSWKSDSYIRLQIPTPPLVSSQTTTACDHQFVFGSIPLSR